MPQKLEGMNAICAYVNRSQSTVLDWIRNRDFPAKKDPKTLTWSATDIDIVKWQKIQETKTLGLKNSHRQSKKSRGKKEL